jgi:predicted ATPase/DNA-binding winged helix-turn-helix (wHTH) protein
MERDPQNPDQGLAGDEASPAGRTILFGPFRLSAARRLLLEGEKPVPLGSRALDILIALTGKPGELLGRDELMASVWPGAQVNPANLTVHIAALRRALNDRHAGKRYIVNIPGRGYRFAAPVTLAHDPSASATPPLRTKQRHNLPVRPARLIGRTDIVTTLARQLASNRLLTVVGPGGMGKTSVALAVAEELLSDLADGTWLIDLAPLADPRRVPRALASALGFEIRSGHPLPGAIARLRDKEALLVLDNCEHLVEAAAALAVEVLRGAPRTRILATSREPLRAEGEHVVRLAPLESPPTRPLSAAEALDYPAVRLFVERATAAMPGFALADKDAAAVAEICRQLDGIPLAIEFAVARVDSSGIRGVADHIDDRTPTRGPPAALPRHHTMKAALDSSYGLLSPAEQKVLRRLAVFAGGFSLDAAGRVAAGAADQERDVADGVTTLVAKSLISADFGENEPRFRLLNTTRAYALAKLAEAGEADRLARRHAEHYRDLLESKMVDPEARLACFASEIDNIRAGLAWALSSKGDRSIGAALAAASSSLWPETSLLTE